MFDGFCTDKEIATDANSIRNMNEEINKSKNLKLFLHWVQSCAGKTPTEELKGCLKADYNEVWKILNHTRTKRKYKLDTVLTLIVMYARSYDEAIERLYWSGNPIFESDKDSDVLIMKILKFFYESDRHATLSLDGRVDWLSQILGIFELENLHLEK